MTKTTSISHSLVSLAAFLVSIGGCAANNSFDLSTVNETSGLGDAVTIPEDETEDEEVDHDEANSGDLYDQWGDPMEAQDGEGGGGAAGGTACGWPVLSGIVRDFRAYEGGKGHPDFQVYTGAGLKGIVKDRLGPDHKPVYAPEGPTEMTSGKDGFDQWYRDVEGVNLAMPLVLVPEIDENGLATYSDPSFFPIDGKGFGNQLFYHNYHFTFELHMTFVYEGGEVFSFGGDDDVFVFVNDRLAIDLGGVHQAQADVIDMDARAEELGLELGEEYTLDFFMAERHTTESKFQIQTTLKFTNCEPIVY